MSGPKIEIVMKFDSNDTSPESIIVARKSEQYAQFMEALLSRVRKQNYIDHLTLLTLMEKHDAGDFIDA